MYQKAMNDMLEEVDYAHAVMDDILVTGRDIAHQNAVLNEVLARAKSHNLKLNFDKVKVRKQEVPYRGHIISSKGLKADPEKVRAMRDMPNPTTKEEVRRFLGSFRYLSKFLPMLAEVETPLRELAKKKISERNWAPFEKEVLAIVFSIQKFREYTMGKPTVVQTDHKPLETVLRKPMATAPLRLQAMILKLSGYDLQIEYLPDKKHLLADTLSRASLDEVPPEDELQVNMVERISITEAKYAQLQQSTANELHELYSIIQTGWPETKQEVQHSIRQYWDTCDDLAILDGVIYRGMRIVVPPTLRPAMLAIIHETHLGTVK